MTTSSQHLQEIAPAAGWTRTRARRAGRDGGSLGARSR
uniref:Uncharacterized protein n=1 Tax=Arundo donax TaxID=35708 RepID=A0A0A9BL68_ARUDO